MSDYQSRNIIKASLSIDAKAALDAACERIGMKQQVLFGRLLDWFVSQKETTQLSILHRLTAEKIAEFNQDAQPAPVHDRPTPADLLRSKVSESITQTRKRRRSPA